MENDPDPNILLIQGLILIIIIVITGMITAFTTAFQSLNKGKLQGWEKEGTKGGRLLSKSLDDSTAFLSKLNLAALLMVLLFSAAVSYFAIENSAFSRNHYEMYIILALLVIGEAVVLMIFSFVYPKKPAQMNQLSTCYRLIIPAYAMAVVVTPLNYIVTIIVKFLLLIAGHKEEDFHEEFSEEEVMSMIETGTEKGELKEEGKKMIDAIFAFDDKLAYEIMTPRTDVFTIDINESLTMYLDNIIKMRYSRIPVYEGAPDNIIGILFLKDLIKEALFQDISNVNIKELLRKPFFVPETKNIDSLFMELKSSKNHIAILIDEYGGFSGIVTMEDILEEIVGEIEDEYDETEADILTLCDKTYLIDGSIDLGDFNEKLGTDLTSSDSETLGGYLLEHLGEIPEDGPCNIYIETGNLKMTILEIKERRIEKVKVEVTNCDNGLTM